MFRLVVSVAPLTEDLLPKLGEACRKLEVLQLPLSWSASALERLCGERVGVEASALFPRLKCAYFKSGQRSSR